MERATWNRLLDEITSLEIRERQNPAAPGQPNAFDKFRRTKIASVEKITGRPLVIYASACTSAKAVPGQLLMIDFTDKVGFKAVTEKIASPSLDILIHSPGGIADAAESIVQQLRGQFRNVRFIVPSFAKSAATMLVMSGNEILMDVDAELGPIDPQMLTPNGASPAVAVLELFEKAQAEIKRDQSRLAAWMPILSQLGPSLLIDCAHAIDLAKNLVEQWTRDFMFEGDPNGAAKARQIAEYLSDHQAFKSHARAVKIPDLQRLGVNVTDLRSNVALQVAIDELYCCLDLLLSNSAVYKMFENSRGDALIRQQQQMAVQLLQGQPGQIAPAPPTPRR
jgi:hypothetical protein